MSKFSVKNANCHEVAQLMIDHGVSQKGTKFNIHGCVFPDGKRLTLDEMRDLVAEFSAPTKQKYWHKPDELRASLQRIKDADPKTREALETGNE